MLDSKHNTLPINPFDAEDDEETPMITVTFGGGILAVPSDMIVLNGMDKEFCRYAYILSVDDERMPEFLYFAEENDEHNFDLEWMLTMCAFSYTGFDLLMETFREEHIDDPNWRPVVNCLRIRDYDEIWEQDGTYTYGMPFVTSEDSIDEIKEEIEEEIQ